MVNMLVKCEAKSNRVKGLAFHPTMPWLLSALHNGTIQLWDYQLGVLLDKFEDHDGPVRGMSFHPNQPLFVSGGDDYKVKVWNYKLKRCLFTLVGHLDYIRTTVFHHEYPWIISASDDQTIRIWNWQSRQCIAVLTGHNHYVMCANFHPKEDLVISASLDQTVRVWDVSGLKEKTVASAGRPHGSPAAHADLFGVNDAVVKFVLEGHDRGVNWADFHPTQSMIASASDDRSIKLWRYNESKAWEIDSLRGHTNNVSAVVFHPRQDLVISNSEDRTIRVWEMNKRQLLHTFRREHDRFWVLACNPANNLMAAGHDGGMVVFKLDRERPLCGAPVSTSAIANHVFVVKNRALIATDPATGTTSVIGNCRKQVSPMASGLKSLIVNPYNSTELNVIVTYDAEDAYDLFTGPNQLVLKPSETASVQAKSGSGSSVAFIARNRFAVLAKDGTSLSIYSTHNELSKKVDLPVTADGVFAGGLTNRVILRCEDKAVLLDTASKETVAELALPGQFRQAVWNTSHVAFILKHGVVIADSDLKFIQAVTETIRVKSGAWDESTNGLSAFVYATSSHIKYALPFSEEYGLIQSISKPAYLVRVHAGAMTFVSRDCSVTKTKMFTHEYMFKLALMQGKSSEVPTHLKNGRLMGSVTIGYLKRKGFPEVALQFVDDLETRFNLSIEFGHIAEALEAAKSIKKHEIWDRLHTEALRMGNIEIAEKAAIANHDIAALLFLYTITGNQAKLTKLSHKLSSSSSSDPMARFNLALIRGDAEERASILSELGLDHLAAKTRETWSSSALVLRPSLSRHIANWPLTRTMEAMFEDQWAGLEAAAKAAAAKLPPAASAEDDVFEDVQAAPAAPVVDTKAWDDDELDAQLEHVQLPVTVSVGSDSGTKPAPLDVVAYGDSRESRWLARRKMPVDLVTCGEFVEALSVLQRRIALVNPAPLKPLFEDIVMASHACVPGLPFTPSISVPISNPEGDGPGILFTVGFLKTKLTEVLHHTGFGNASEALAAARYVIHALTVTLAKSSEEEAELLEILATAQKYAHAMLIETTRRESTSDKVREMELAAYLCCEKLEPIHTLLVTDLAMKMAFKSKCYIQASLFAKRIITGSWGSSDEFVTASTTRARKVIIASEERGTDEFKTNFDAAWMTAGEGFKLCSGTLTPVPPQLHDKMVACPLCKSSFHPDYQGQACTVCQLSQVGATALGLQFLPL